jgi:hypothetical protein
MQFLKKSSERSEMLKKAILKTSISIPLFKASWPFLPAAGTSCVFVHIMNHTVRRESPWLNTRWVAIQDGLNRWNVLETARDFVLFEHHT